MTTKKIDSALSFAGAAVLGERGQVVIPKEARQILKLRPGENFLVMVHHDTIMLLPKKRMAEFIKQLSAKFNI